MLQIMLNFVFYSTCKGFVPQRQYHGHVTSTELKSILLNENKSVLNRENWQFSSIPRFVVLLHKKVEVLSCWHEVGVKTYTRWVWSWPVALFTLYSSSLLLWRSWCEKKIFCCYVVSAMSHEKHIDYLRIFFFLSTSKLSWYGNIYYWGVIPCNFNKEYSNWGVFIGT